MADSSLHRFRHVVGVALTHLEERRREINDLNVFPVADGDTGDNMALTMSHVLEEIDRLESETNGELKRPQLVRAVARAALMGARGNSGVILSQIVRGAASELASPPGKLIDPELVELALSRASEFAYASVREPAEGTMLTVIRAMAEAVAERRAEWLRGRLDPEAGDAEQNALLAEMLATALVSGEAALRRTPEQLDVLAEAGVVDAGALGLVIIVRGLVAGLAGEQAQVPEIPHYAAARLDEVHHADSRFRYCTNFIVTGEGLDADAYAGALEELGDSVLVVGDEATLKVHLHTDDPDAAKGLFARAGRVQREDIADMHEQVADQRARLEAGRSAVVAVASGEGMRRMFWELGALVVDGGPTLNPPTKDILSAIEDCAAPEVVVLPNSRNVTMAAEEAARLTDKTAIVAPSASQQAALAALVEFDPADGAERNCERLRGALEAVRAGAVAPAARDDADGRFRQGDSVGFAGERIVAWGGAGSTLLETVTELAGGAEIVTVIEGAEAPIELERLALTLPDGAELELHRGDTPNYSWLITAQ
ncbi:MAG: DAK2 domain-containing protein [Solirubrobacterales bacterium]|nr:DAK2 domain-containing protein [Solirubrobacterales bacterium]